MPPVAFALYCYRGKVARVVDGDTVVIEFDYGMRLRKEESVRIAGLDTPELRRGTPEERARGALARDELSAWLPEWSEVYVVTHKDAQNFNRYIADVYIPDGDDVIDVAAVMRQWMLDQWPEG